MTTISRGTRGPVTAEGRHDRAAAAASATPASPRSLEVAIEPGRVLRTLLVCVAGFVLAGIAAAVLWHGIGNKFAYGFVPLFDLNRENNLPALFSSLQMILAAGLILVLGQWQADNGQGWRLHWTLLAAGFVFMAFDEMVGIHELANRPMRALVAETSVLTPAAWGMAGAALVGGLAVFYLPFLRALPRRFALLFAGSGALYLFGVLVLEMIGSVIYARLGPGSFAMQAEIVAEEACEMVGMSCFIYSLLLYMRDSALSVRLTLSPGDLQSAARLSSQAGGDRGAVG